MIQVKRLEYSYPGAAEQTLRGLDFDIGRGEIFGFLGPSGSGKSTTQNILIGLLEGYAGSVQVLGQEVRHIGPDFYERIGVGFEFPNFYAKLTAFENLSLFRSLYSVPTEDPLQLLDRVGLKDVARFKVSQLSKGMKMRLNFCRAVMHRPKVLFLDEPTSGLDPVNANVIKDLIRGMKTDGKTVLLTTHHMQAAEQLCDRVAFIVDGQIRLIDSPRALKLRHGRKTVRVEYRNEGVLSVQEFPLEQIGSNESFLQLIRCCPVEAVHSQEATLEQIFVETTGRSLL